MKNMKWNKVVLKPVRDEYGIEFIWSGKLPELFERVLVYTDKSKRVYMDIWDILDNGNGFKTMNSPVFYWMSLPEPPRIVSLQ